MTQRNIDRAVARITGEELREIRRMGFHPFDPFEADFDPEPDLLAPQAVDWDELDGLRAA